MLARPVVLSIAEKRPLGEGQQVMINWNADRPKYGTPTFLIAKSLEALGGPLKGVDVRSV